MQRNSSIELRTKALGFHDAVVPGSLGVGWELREGTNGPSREKSKRDDMSDGALVDISIIDNALFGT